MKVRITSKSQENAIKEHLNCDIETGIITWKKHPNRTDLNGQQAGTVNKRYRYISIMVNRIAYGAHRLVWFFANNKWPKNDIDHINGDGRDNRICNLRDVTHRQNQMNRYNHRSGKLVGAWKKGKKYESAIMIDGKIIHIGRFKTKVEAHQAYLKKVKEIGEEHL